MQASISNNVLSSRLGTTSASKILIFVVLFMGSVIYLGNFNNANAFPAQSPSTKATSPPRSGADKESFSQRHSSPKMEVVPKVSARCVDSQQVAAALAATNHTLLQLYSRWEVQRYPLFMSFFHIPPKSWQIQKQKFIRLILRGDL